MNLFDKIKLKAIRDNFVIPTLGRLGTALAGYLVGAGVAEDQSKIVGAATAIVLGLAYDYIVDFVARKMAERKGEIKALTHPRRTL